MLCRVEVLWPHSDSKRAALVHDMFQTPKSQSCSRFGKRACVIALVTPSRVPKLYPALVQCLCVGILLGKGAPFWEGLACFFVRGNPRQQARRHPPQGRIPRRHGASRQEASDCRGTGATHGRVAHCPCTHADGLDGASWHTRCARVRSGCVRACCACACAFVSRLLHAPREMVSHARQWALSRNLVRRSEVHGAEEFKVPVSSSYTFTETRRSETSGEAVMEVEDEDGELLRDDLSATALMTRLDKSTEIMSLSRFQLLPGVAHVTQARGGRRLGTSCSPACSRPRRKDLAGPPDGATEPGPFRLLGSSSQCCSAHCSHSRQGYIHKYITEMGRQMDRVEALQALLAFVGLVSNGAHLGLPQKEKLEGFNTPRATESLGKCNHTRLRPRSPRLVGAKKPRMCTKLLNKKNEYNDQWNKLQEFQQSCVTLDVPTAPQLLNA